MSSTQIDKFRTALANGYDEGQAKALAMWSLKDFMLFMKEVIPANSEERLWVTMDGSLQKEPKAGLETRKPSQNWY